MATRVANKTSVEWCIRGTETCVKWCVRSRRSERLLCVNRGGELLSRGSDLLSRSSELLSRSNELLSRSSELLNRASDRYFNWTSNLNFDGIRHGDILFNWNVYNLFDGNGNCTLNGNRAFPLYRVGNGNLLRNRNLDNAFNSLDNIVRDRYLSDNLLVLRDLYFDLYDYFIRYLDLVRNGNLNFHRVRDITSHLHSVRSGYWNLNIDISGSLDWVRNLYLDLNWNGNINRNLNNSFDRIRNIDKYLYFPGDGNTVRNIIRYVNIVVDFHIVRDFNSNFNRNGNINGNKDLYRVGNLNVIWYNNLVRYLDLNLNRDLNLIRNGNSNLNGNLDRDRNLDGNFDGVRTRDRVLYIIRNRYIYRVSDLALALNCLNLNNRDIFVTRNFNVLDLFNGYVNINRPFDVLFLNNRYVLLNNLFNRNGNRDLDVIGNWNLYIIRNRYRHSLVNICVTVLVHRLRVRLGKALLGEPVVEPSIGDTRLGWKLQLCASSKD